MLQAIGLVLNACFTEKICGEIPSPMALVIVGIGDGRRQYSNKEDNELHLYMMKKAV